MALAMRMRMWLTAIVEGITGGGPPSVTNPWRTAGDLDDWMTSGGATVWQSSEG
jgi:hypothetical protein